MVLWWCRRTHAGNVRVPLPTTLSRAPPFSARKAANSFWDYPSNGSSNLRWFISANDFGPPDTSAVLTINKAPRDRCIAYYTLYRGLTPLINLALPIIRDNSNVATFLGTGSGSGTVCSAATM